MTEPKELAIGEIGEIDGVKVRCIARIDEQNPCGRCFADGTRSRCSSTPCLPTERDDGLDVVFEEVVDA